MFMAHAIDEQFYLAADEFFKAHTAVGLTFDDITLATRYSAVLPKQTATDTELSPALRLHVPIISSDMDTVTESRMAIAMARLGGLGLIHYNMSSKDQVREVAKVKNHIHGLIQEPIKIGVEDSISSVMEMCEHRQFTFRSFPVVDAEGRLVGLLTSHLLSARHSDKIVQQVMLPREQLDVLRQSELGSEPIKVADRYFTDHPGAHKLMVVDDSDKLRGMLTLTDVEHIINEARADTKPARDSKFRLICGAAISAPRTNSGDLDKEKLLDHVGHLVDEGLDAVAVSTAHGHTLGVGECVRAIRATFPSLTIIAGNVTSAEGVQFLASSGADAIKVGQGPGSICTTRIVAGVGIPQMTALYVCSRAARECGVKILADGGITKSGDIVKALTLADAVICGGLLAGCKEAPGELLEIDGKTYKRYRGMGSLEAMKAGAAARYGHDKKDQISKVAAEGIEALKEVSGSIEQLLRQLVGGLQSGMGYLGACNLAELKSFARYIQVSPAGMREAAPHDVVEVKANQV